MVAQRFSRDAGSWRVRGALLSAAVVVALAAGAQSARAVAAGSTPREIELGKDAAKDIAKSVEFVDDEQELEKLRAMLKEIGAATERPDVDYVPHIVASPLVNAFTLPGGFVYVTTGLLDDVESDDELAGVLAHEIAHNVHQDAINMMRHTPKGLGLMQLAAIAALIIGHSPEAAILANTAANTITAMVLQGNSIEAEKNADWDGIRYITQTHYNPVGFLTFMERLASSSGKFLEQDMGIYRTHPMTRDRVDSARKRLQEFGVPLHRRLVTKAPQPEAHRLLRDDLPVTEIAYRNERLFLLAGHDSTHAAAAVSAVGWALDHEVDESEIKVSPAEGGVVLTPNGGPSLFLSTDDGTVNGKGEVVLAGAVRRRLAELVAEERTRIQANSQMY
ncbi:MAG: M48 family metalloprotease [bacterium]